MSWFAALLRGLVLALATLVLALAAGLLALEHSGWLTSRVQAALAARLGDPVEIDAVHLRWMEAALEIEGLSLGLQGSRLDRVRVVLRGGRGTILRVALVEVSGGRVVLGEALQERLIQRPSLTGRAVTVSAGQPAAPAVAIRDLELAVSHPTWGEIPLGNLQASYSLDERGHQRLGGRLLPHIAESAQSSQGSTAVYLIGRETAPGEFELTLSCAGVPVSLARLPDSTSVELLRSTGLHGVLALEGRAQVSLATAEVSHGELRVRLANGELLIPGSESAVQGAALDLQARCAPGPGESAYDAGAWRAVLHGEATWREAGIDAWGVWGSHAGRDLRGRAWLHLRDLPLESETFEYLRLNPALAQVVAALEPRGRCEVLVAGELPAEGALRTALEVSCDGRAGLTYHGWPGLDGVSQGFPMPVGRVQGRLVGSFDPARPSAMQLAIVRAQGTHGDGRASDRIAWASGQIRRPVGAPRGTPAELVVRLAGRGFPVDGGEVPDGLAGLKGTDWIWPTFSPSGGEASFEALLSKRQDDAHLGARFDIDLEGVGIVWDQLPLPARDLRGRLALRFDPRLSWGAAFRVEGRTLTSDRIAMVGRLQRDPGVPPPPASPTADPLGGVIEELSVEARNIALRGLDRQAVEGVLPALELALQQVAPAGKVDVRVQSSRSAGQREGSFVAEISSREVQFSPQAFRVPTRNVRGRVLVGGNRLLPGANESSGAGGVRVALAPLIGEWPGGVLVACDATFGPQPGRERLEVFASGVDPLNRGMVGALQAALTGPRGGLAGLDLSALSVDGRVDVDGTLVLDEGRAARPSGGRFRVHLRDNDFRMTAPSGPDDPGGFGLGRLRGALVQDGGVLSGSDLRARLGRTPLVLREARFELVDEGGYRLEARPTILGLPLDREHLRFFLDPATVEALVEGLDFTGRLDIDDARLVLSGTRDGTGSVRLQGQVRPHALHVDFGLPLDVETASVALESLVFEDGHVRAWASVAGLDGSLAGRKLSDARLQLTFVEPRLSIFDLEGMLEGGRLADLGEKAARVGPAFSIDLQVPFRFDLGLRLVNVRVENLLRGLFESEFASRGVLSGELRLEGSLEQVREIRGDGALRLRDTTLWSIPVMQALFSQLGFDDTAVFERMRTRFQVRDGVFHMNGMQVYSPLLQLVGAGTLDMEGRLHHDLEVRYSLVDRLGPFTRLVYWVQNNLLRLAVRGDMSRPRIELQGFLSVFQARPASGRDLPLPGLAPLSARF